MAGGDLETEGLCVPNIRLCAGQVGSLGFSGLRMRYQGRALWLCTLCYPTMSHLASSRLMQKSSLARPERRAHRPSPKDVSFWAPVMYIVGSQRRFESLRKQSSGFGYVALAGPGWCEANPVLACLRAGAIGMHSVWWGSVFSGHTFLPHGIHPTARN